ncbi:MAG: F0F1 ATP synthase subunit B [Alphaproteobacteria bacterium]|nr:F0F1 ATP synthase subunit B [Alphaproteobacteria bacterium]
MESLWHSTTFWAGVAFVVFVVLAYKPGKRILTGALDERIAKIREEIEEAQRLREEAQSTLASYQRRQREALQEAETIIEHAREEAERARAHAETELEASITRREQQAAEKIAQAEAAALDDIRNRAVELAIGATAKLLEEKLAGKAGEKSVSDAIKVLSDKLH